MRQTVALQLLTHLGLTEPCDQCGRECDPMTMSPDAYINIRRTAAGKLFYGWQRYCPECVAAEAQNRRAWHVG